MKSFLEEYIRQQATLTQNLPLDKVVSIIALFRAALEKQKNIFVFGNGGSAANASHFVTDLGKGASDVATKRFRCVSINDNTAWMTALGNDYSYEDVFVRQLMNLADPGDLLYTMSVSGNSPNLVKAVEWANQNDVHAIALTGAKGGKLSEIAKTVLVVPDSHYGRVEDAHMSICHMVAYAFMEEAR